MTASHPPGGKTKKSLVTWIPIPCGVTANAKPFPYLTNDLHWWPWLWIELPLKARNPSPPIVVGPTKLWAFLESIRMVIGWFCSWPITLIVWGLEAFAISCMDISGSTSSGVPSLFSASFNSSCISSLSGHTPFVQKSFWLLQQWPRWNFSL